MLLRIGVLDAGATVMLHNVAKSCHLGTMRSRRMARRCGSSFNTILMDVPLSSQIVNFIFLALCGSLCGWLRESPSAPLQGSPSTLFALALEPPPQERTMV